MGVRPPALSLTTSASRLAPAVTSHKAPWSVAMSPGEPVTGLILSGGGARAAYQVGVLAAIAELLPLGADNPFPVIVGTSAGAINAVSLASGAMDFRAAIERLTAFWQGFRSHLVLRSDWPGVIRQASRFVSHSLLGHRRPGPGGAAQQLAVARAAPRQIAHGRHRRSHRAKAVACGGGHRVRLRVGPGGDLLSGRRHDRLLAAPSADRRSHPVVG